MRTRTALTTLAILVLTAWVSAEEPKADASKNAALEARQKQRTETLQTAVANKDFDKVLSVLDEMIADKDISDNDRFGATCAEFIILAAQKKDGTKACPVAKKLSESKQADATVLNMLAWTILDTEGLKNRDLDLAMTIAQKAAEASKFADGQILDTLARAYYEKGNLDKAIEYQAKAVEKCNEDKSISNEVKTQIKETLEKYQNKKADMIS
jgi:tetratricopeptide (TPR) repeat protein